MIGSMKALADWPTDEFGPVLTVGDIEVRLEPLLRFPGEPRRALVAVYRDRELVGTKVPVTLDVHGGDDG